MTMTTFGRQRTASPTPLDGYRSGSCNIGPEEIARRRRAGHVGLLITLALLALLVVVDVPPLWRLALTLPAAGAASGYLQAWLKFCAGFGTRGVFNFGPLGEMVEVADEVDLRRDRMRARQIGLAALAIGLAVGAIAAVVPL
jgi:hypothetical protein